MECRDTVHQLQQEVSMTFISPIVPKSRLVQIIAEAASLFLYTVHARRTAFTMAMRITAPKSATRKL